MRDSLIVNRTWDRYTINENNQSLILKLLNPLDTAVTINGVVTINKKILKTQTENISVISAIAPPTSDLGLAANEGAI